MRRPGRYLTAMLIIAASAIIAPLLMTREAHADLLGETVPKVSLSDPNGAHMFFIRKGTGGYQRDVRLTAYYPTNVSNWNQQYLSITTGPDGVNNERVCEVMGPSTNSYFEIILEGRNVQRYLISKSKVCDENGSRVNQTGVNSNNIFFGRYPLPDKPDPDNQTLGNFLKVDVTIRYGFDTSGHSELGGVRFKVDSSVSSAKLGPKGGDETYAFSILSPWTYHDAPAYQDASIRVPFGMTCNSNQDSRNVTVGVYDADNGPNGAFPSNNLRFYVEDVTNEDRPSRVNLSNKTGGTWWPNDGEPPYRILKPTDGNRDRATADMTLEKDRQYVLVVLDINPQNTIDVRIPGDSIFGDPEACKEQWNVVGSSDVKHVGVSVNDGVIEYERGSEPTLRFEHQIRNKGRNTSDRINMSVRWGKAGVRTGQVEAPPSRTLTADGTSGAVRNADNTFTVPTNARSGDVYCQFVRWDPVRASGTPAQRESDDACVELRPFDPPPPNARLVTLRAVASGGGDTETLGAANFNGYINVSGYPAAEEGGWGYNSYATEVAAQRTTAQLQQNGTISSQSRTTYTCPSGYSPSSPSSYSSTSCSRTVTTQNPCVSPYVRSGSECVYTEWVAPNAKGNCPTGYSPFGSTICFRQFRYNPGTSTQTYYSYPNALTEYRYFCLQNSTWTGWTTGGSTCNDYYVCPGGTTAGAGWARSPSSISCNSWECRYQSSPFDSRIYVQSQAPKCEYRCAGISGEYPGAAGARPYLARNTANTTGSGELRCFMQPVFDLTCYWDTGTSTTVRVNGNGNFCSTNTTKPAGGIGLLVCATLNSRTPTSWMPGAPQPGLVYRPATGTRAQHVWMWARPIAGSGCSNVVGMPYVKVYGGDVRVGGGVGGTSGVCESNASANIQTRNQGPSGYAGAGTQFAAISNGFISGFVSGQYNNLATSPNPGSNPTKLSFANNAGGSGYGGGFASSGPCYDYVGKLPTDAQVSSGNTAVGGRTVAPGTKTVQHVRGNAYISGNITYGSGWTTAGSIPLFQLVVEGNIYIDDNVSQLDGVYAAIATNSTTGNIYTCSFVSGASATVPSQTYLAGSNNCKRQLVVNGALAAKKIHFLRDCGSLRWGSLQNPERTVYSGGSSTENCSPGNSAAEVINYTPEMWIRSSSGSGGNKYDSISSMPPVL